MRALSKPGAKNHVLAAIVGDLAVKGHAPLPIEVLHAIEAAFEMGELTERARERARPRLVGDPPVGLPS